MLTTLTHLQWRQTVVIGLKVSQIAHARETVARQRRQLVMVEIQELNVGQAADNVRYRG